MKCAISPRPVALVCAVMFAILIIAHYQSAAKLRENAKSLREQRDQLSALAEENVRLSNMLLQISGPKIRASAPSAELLRLRGKVTQLRYEADMLREENRERHHQDSINEMYATGGFDTNGLPDPDLGTTKGEVISEIKNGPATIVTEEDRFIRAEAVVANTNGGSMALVMKFGFDEGGRLFTRTDSEK